MRYTFAFVLGFMPLFASAQTPQDLNELFQTIIRLINDVVPLVFAIAFIAFLWGVFVYFIQGGDDESKRETGRSYILYALLGFFIMLGIWGIVNVLNGTFGFNDQTKPNLPCFGSTSDCNQGQNQQQTPYINNLSPLPSQPVPPLNIGSPPPPIIDNTQNFPSQPPSSNPPISI